MKKTTYTCDQCNKDLTYTGAVPAYRISLFAEKLFHQANAIAAIYIYPPIDEPHHFCGLNCLHEWVKTMTLTEID